MHRIAVFCVSAARTKTIDSYGVNSLRHNGPFMRLATNSFSVRGLRSSLGLEPQDRALEADELCDKWASFCGV